MAASGEERMLTLFADVHYYFGVPGPRPVNHRFDKESYVYLYRDAAQKRGRLEIANHAGTPEQDAFTGYLDNSKMVQSNKHPALVTVTVDAFKPASSAPAQNEHHWRLPSTDPRDEGKYLFRLHTLDLYFWTVEDAQSFLQNAQQALRAEQLNVDALPVPPHHGNSMSPVVQQLETVAFTDPAYMNGKTRDSRATSTVANAEATSSPAPSAQVSQTQREEAKKEQDPAAFTPLAYNPAAPPAPEEHKHREKTPPPPEALAAGTGLAAAAYNDHLHAQQRPPGSVPAPSPGYPLVGQVPGLSPASAPYGSPSPAHGVGVASPPAGVSPQAPSGKRPSNAGSNYFPGPPTAAAPSATSHYAPTAASPYSPGAPNAHLNPQQGEPLSSPTAEILGSSYQAGRGQPLQHLQPQYANYLASHPPQQQAPGKGRPALPPVGSYSNYSYEDEPHHHHHHHSTGGAGGNPYATGDANIHGQVYRPTEDEEPGYGRHGSSSSGTGAGPGQQPGKLEEKAMRAEKGINKFLRKVEKKIG